MATRGIVLPATAPCMHGVDLRQQGRRPFTAASRQQAHLRDCICSAEQRQGSANDAAAPTRRSMLTGMLTATAVQLLPFAQPAPAMAAAYVAPPAGKRRNLDVLDGYEFLYPDYYAPVTTSGNDAFFRNPYNVEENLFVNITSPSSSKFENISDFGTPEQAAERLKQQYLGEFMSTRLGSQKKAEVLSAKERTVDGRTYYDIEMRAQSFASRSPLAQTQQEVNSTIEMEWDRRLLFALGVANRRLYELRLQAPEAKFEANEEDLRSIPASFRLRDMQAR
mmetsp:Transcript_408/g.1207  ORF Transcript_408/g.1207 Transcript_408/m.1207 type:complete len:279 (+) Transcript_408:94-930(+)